eukprot:jgi/Chlat1/7639/Chrsp64S07113
MRCSSDDARNRHATIRTTRSGQDCKHALRVAEEDEDEERTVVVGAPREDVSVMGFGGVRWPSSVVDGYRRYGPGLAGAVCGAGWWIWLDAVLCNDRTVPFLHYLPGIIATVALLMFNCVRKEDVMEYSSMDDGEGCRQQLIHPLSPTRLRFFLFLSYLVSLGSLGFGVWVLVAGYAVHPDVNHWPGVAVLIHCTLVLCSGLIFWTSRSAGVY